MSGAMQNVPAIGVRQDKLKLSQVTIRPEFEFNTVYFFIPLIIVMQVTFFFGCWFLPVILTLLNLQSLKFGSPAAEEDCKQNSNTELNELPRREVPRLDSGNSSNYEYDA